MSHRTWLLLCQLLSICSSYWPWNWPCVLCWSVTHLGDGCPLVQNTGLLCFPTLFHSKLNKAQTGPFPPPQTVPRFLNFLLSLQKSAMFLFYFTWCRCAQLGGISEYYNFCDWGINFHINTGYLVNFIKFWIQSFLYVILPMKCSIWKVFQLERTLQLYHL